MLKLCEHYQKNQYNQYLMYSNGKKFQLLSLLFNFNVTNPELYISNTFYLKWSYAVPVFIRRNAM